jgi:hypothetical protein
LVKAQSAHLNAPPTDVAGHGDGRARPIATSFDSLA